MKSLLSIYFQIFFVLGYAANFYSSVECKNGLDGAALTSPSSQVKKATIVSLLKSMAAERAHKKKSPIVLNRNSEVFQSYLEQRRPSRSGDYSFLDTLFREEVPVTTPSPDKFTGGATVYKPSTQSPPALLNVPIHNGIETNIYNYKIVKKAPEPTSTPTLELKPANATKNSIFGGTLTHFSNSIDNQGKLNKPSKTFGRVTKNFGSHVTKETLPFPSFENQFYNSNSFATPAPPPKIIKEIKNSFEPNVYKANPNVHQGSFITTSRPKTSRPTHKYYMNLVTEQPYLPPKKYKEEQKKEVTFSVALADNEDIKEIPPSINGSLSYLSQDHSTFNAHKPLSTTFTKPFDTDAYIEPSFYYKDVKDDIIADISTHDTSSISSNVPGKFQSPIVPLGDKNIVNYVPIDKPKFYYKPLEQEAQTEEPVFYYKPIVPKTETKTIVYKQSNTGSYSKPFSTSSNSFAIKDPTKTLQEDSTFASQVPVVSQLKYTTPHPLVYGFKPLTFKDEPYTPATSRDRSPKYLSSLPFSSKPEVSKLRHYSPFSPPKKLYEDDYPNISVSKPVRFPYDKRHYYSGRFVSTFK